MAFHRQRPSGTAVLQMLQSMATTAAPTFSKQDSEPSELGILGILVLLMQEWHMQ